MKVNDESDGTGLKIFLILFGFLLIGLVVLFFGVIDFSNIENLISNFGFSAKCITKEVVYEIFVLFFLIFALIWPIYLLKISHNIKKVTREFSAKDDSDFEKICKKKKAFLGIWKSYKSTFINNTNNEFNDFENRTRVDADLYFNSEEIVKSHFLKLPLISFLKLVSGSFVGLGILGTFIGFSQSLSGGIDIQNQEQLNVIVDGLKIAFNTSIFGIFSSIIYNFLVVHPLIQMINDNSRSLCDELDNRFYISDEFCTRTLGHIVYETRCVIENSNSDMAQKVADAILQGRQSFTVELNKTTDTLKSLSEELSKTPESIKCMNEELKNSIESVKESNKEMIEASISAIKEKTESLFDSFIYRFDKTSNIISDTVTSLKKVPDDIHTLLENVSREMQNDFELVINKAQENYKDFMTSSECSIKKSIDDTSNAVIENNKNIIEESLQKIQIISTSIVDSFNKVVELSSSSISSIINDAKNQVNNTYTGIAETITAAADKIENVTKSFDNINDEYKEFTKVFEGITKEAKNAENELTDSIRAIFQELPDKLKYLVDDLSEAALRVSNSIDSLDSIKELPVYVSGLLNDFVKVSKQLETSYEGTMDKIVTLYNFCNAKETESADVLKQYVDKIDNVSVTNVYSEKAYKELVKTINDKFERLVSVLSKFSLSENKKISEGENL